MADFAFTAPSLAHTAENAIWFYDSSSMTEIDHAYTETGPFGDEVRYSQGPLCFDRASSTIYSLRVRIQNPQRFQLQVHSQDTRENRNNLRLRSFNTSGVVDIDTTVTMYTSRDTYARRTNDRAQVVQIQSMARYGNFLVGKFWWEPTDTGNLQIGMHPVGLFAVNVSDPTRPIRQHFVDERYRFMMSTPSAFNSPYGNFDVLGRNQVRVGQWVYFFGNDLDTGSTPETNEFVGIRGGLRQPNDVLPFQLVQQGADTKDITGVSYDGQYVFVATYTGLHAWFPQGQADPLNWVYIGNLTSSISATRCAAVASTPGGRTIAVIRGATNPFPQYYVCLQGTSVVNSTQIFTGNSNDSQLGLAVRADNIALVINQTASGQIGNLTDAIDITTGAATYSTYAGGVTHSPPFNPIPYLEWENLIPLN